MIRQVQNVNPLKPAQLVVKEREADRDQVLHNFLVADHYPVLDVGNVACRGERPPLDPLLEYFLDLREHRNLHSVLFHHLMHGYVQNDPIELVQILLGTEQVGAAAAATATASTEPAFTLALRPPLEIHSDPLIQKGDIVHFFIHEGFEHAACALTHCLFGPLSDVGEHLLILLLLLLGLLTASTAHHELFLLFVLFNELV